MHKGQSAAVLLLTLSMHLEFLSERRLKLVCDALQLTDAHQRKAVGWTCVDLQLVSDVSGTGHLLANYHRWVNYQLCHRCQRCAWITCVCWHAQQGAAESDCARADRHLPGPARLPAQGLREEGAPCSAAPLGGCLC